MTYTGASTYDGLAELYVARWPARPAARFSGVLHGLHACDELNERELNPAGYPSKRPERDVAPPALDQLKDAVVDPRTLGDDLLRLPQLGSPSPDHFAELAQQRPGLRTPAGGATRSPTCGSTAGGRRRIVDLLTGTRKRILDSIIPNDPEAAHALARKAGSLLYADFDLHVKLTVKGSAEVIEVPVLTDEVDGVSRTIRAYYDDSLANPGATVNTKRTVPGAEPRIVDGTVQVTPGFLYREAVEWLVAQRVPLTTMTLGDMHAETEMALKLITKLLAARKGLPLESVGGTVRFVLDRAMCDECSVGLFHALNSMMAKEGILAQISRLLPDVVFELKVINVAVDGTSSVVTLMRHVSKPNQPKGIFQVPQQYAAEGSSHYAQYEFLKDQNAAEWAKYIRNGVVRFQQGMLQKW